MPQITEPFVLGAQVLLKCLRVRCASPEDVKDV